MHARPKDLRRKRKEVIILSSKSQPTRTGEPKEEEDTHTRSREPNTCDTMPDTPLDARGPVEELNQPNHKLKVKHKASQLSYLPQTYLSANHLICNPARMIRRSHDLRLGCPWAKEQRGRLQSWRCGRLAGAAPTPGKGMRGSRRRCSRADERQSVLPAPRLALCAAMGRDSASVRGHGG